MHVWCVSINQSFIHWFIHVGWRVAVASEVLRASLHLRDFLFVTRRRCLPACAIVCRKGETSYTGAILSHHRLRRIYNEGETFPWGRRNFNRMGENLIPWLCRPPADISRGDYLMWHRHCGDVNAVTWPQVSARREVIHRPPVSAH